MFVVAWLWVPAAVAAGPSSASMSPAESATNSFALSQPIVSPEITQHRSAPSRVVARSRTVTMVPLGRSATSGESSSTPARRRAPLLPETTKTGAAGPPAVWARPASMSVLPARDGNQLDRDGQRFGDDKHVWLQGRQVWMLSKLCRDKGDQQLLDAARLGAESRGLRSARS